MELERRVKRLEELIYILVQVTDERFENMALNLDALKAAVDVVAANILAVSQAIANPAVDNNDQTVIDELTTRLNNSAAALQSATAEENAEKGVAPVAAPADPAPAATSAPAAVDPAAPAAPDGAAPAPSSDGSVA